MDRVSVIIPVFNGERYLAEALNSVFAQDHPAFEVIVVDDGSSDGTKIIAQSYQDVCYIFQENQGQTAALNTGLEHGRGELIAFLDADDLWTQGKLKLQVEFLNKHPEIDIVIGQMNNFYDQGEDFENRAMGIGTILARKKVFDRIGGFDAAYKHEKVVDWVVRAKEAGISIKVMPEVVMRRRLHDANQSYQRKDKTHELLKLVKASLKRRTA